MASDGPCMDDDMEVYIYKQRRRIQTFKNTHIQTQILEERVFWIKKNTSKAKAPGAGGIRLQRRRSCAIWCLGISCLASVRLRLRRCYCGTRTLYTLTVRFNPSVAHTHNVYNTNEIYSGVRPALVRLYVHACVYIFTYTYRI